MSRRRGLVACLTAASFGATALTGCSGPAPTSVVDTAAPTTTTAASASTTAYAPTPTRVPPVRAPTRVPPPAPAPTPVPAPVPIPAPAPDETPSTGGLRLAATATGPLSGRVVVLDPGHNGRQATRPDILRRAVPAGGGRTKACNTTGTATRAGYPEHAHNWDVAVRAASRLRALGAAVVLTRPDDRGVGPCVDERAVIGNRAGADAVVSVHADGAPQPSARGFHVITSTATAGGPRVRADSAALAKRLRDTFARLTGMPRSTYLGAGRAITPRDDIAGLNLSTRVAVMLEAGNMHHPVDSTLLSDPAFRQREADALTATLRQLLAR